MKKCFSMLVFGPFFALCATAQVEIDKPVHLTGGSGDRAIKHLEAPVDGTDAVNKDYVDSAVSASGGGGSAMPSMISNESAAEYTYADAVYYCSTLSEGGHDDWRIPTEEEIQYFSGIPSATSSYLWTKTRSSIDYSANQNFITVKLDDGSWRNGDEMLMPVDMRVQTTTTQNLTPWSFVSTIEPTVSGNWLKLTQIVLQTRGGYSRIKYNFPNGTSAYSPTYTNTTTTVTTTMSWANTVTPILVSSIDVESYAAASGTNNWSILNINGFEINPFQKVGNSLNVRCVR